VAWEEYEAHALCQAIQGGRRPGAGDLARALEDLPQDALLVDFARYPCRDPRNRRSLGSRYAAFLVHPRESAVRIVDLGEASLPGGRGLEDELQRFFAAARQVGTSREASGWKAWILRSLHGRILGPLARNLPRGFLGVDTLVLCPDGLLALLPFEILQDGDGRVLLDRFQVEVLPSPLDLGPGPAPPDGPWTILPGGDAWDGEGERLARLGIEAALPVSLELGSSCRWLLVGASGTPVDPPGPPEARPDLPPPSAQFEAAVRGWPWSGETTLEESPSIRGLGALGERMAPWMAGEGDGPGLACDCLCLPGLEAVPARTGMAFARFRDGLVQGGARSLLSSLWPVPAPVREAFLTRFYAGLLGGLPGIDAFRKARAALREAIEGGVHAYAFRGGAFRSLWSTRRGLCGHRSGRRPLSGRRCLGHHFRGLAPAAVALDLRRCPEWAWGTFVLSGRPAAVFHKELDPRDFAW
jgi:hypothetical protein